MQKTTSPNTVGPTLWHPNEQMKGSFGQAKVLQSEKDREFISKIINGVTNLCLDL